MRSPLDSLIAQAGLAGGESAVRQTALPGLGRPLSPSARPILQAPTAQKIDLSDLTVAPPPSRSPDQLYELGLTTAAMGFHTAAIEALRDCTALAPDHAHAWRKLADLLRLADDDEGANAAEATASRLNTPDVGAGTAAGDSQPGRVDKAERRLRDQLRFAAPREAMATLRNRLVANPREAAAMRLLARLEMLSGDHPTAWSLLERALDICPGYIGAREDYADSLLERRYQAAAAEVQSRRLLEIAPRDPRYRRMHAYALMYTGKIAAAADGFADLAREFPREADYWLAYAQALHFLGRRDDSARAYRACLDLRPEMGAAYWGLADLKGGYITASDITAVRTLLGEAGLESGSRIHAFYTLAHYLERAGDFAASFQAYADGARLFRATAEQTHKGHDRARATEDVRRIKAVFSRENLARRLSPAPVPEAGTTPIFIVGMPRAGSTLVEQILASHSQVEGTRELPLIGDVKRALARSRIVVNPDAYPECILDLSQRQLSALGARVLERARDYRDTDRPFFIDKRPWNWQEVGLIHLILPHARIIDIRREPMAACFAMFKQLLPSDAAFSYDLGDLGHYYNTYVALMDHWRAVLPGRVHFMDYERLVDETESEIRRLLDYCGLPFEAGCLRFWETDRAVSTPSAEQVRRPIFRDALQQWRNFEAWLGPLREALDKPAEAWANTGLAFLKAPGNDDP